MPFQEKSLRFLLPTARERGQGSLKLFWKLEAWVERGASGGASDASSHSDVKLLRKVPNNLDLPFTKNLLRISGQVVRNLN
jgi:hypothetical protein